MPHAASTPKLDARARADAMLLRRYAATRDPELRAQIVERFLPLANTIALRFRRAGHAHEDLLQVASLALLKAVDRYDPELGRPFAAYAVPTISGEIRRYFRDATWSVRPPRDLLERALRVENAVQRLTDRHGRSPTLAMLVADLDLGEEEILEARHARQGMDAVSLQERINGEMAGAREDLIGVEEPGYERAEERAVLQRLLRGVKPRERVALTLRFADDMTLAQIGEVLGLGQMQVSRIIRNGLARMEQMASAS